MAQNTKRQPRQAGTEKAAPPKRPGANHTGRRRIANRIPPVAPYPRPDIDLGELVAAIGNATKAQQEVWDCIFGALWNIATRLDISAGGVSSNHKSRATEIRDADKPKPVEMVASRIPESRGQR